MHLDASFPASTEPFEGDLTLLLRGLPPDAVVRRAAVTLDPAVALTTGFEEVIRFTNGVGDFGADLVAGNGFAEVDFHARRQLSRVGVPSDVEGSRLQVDLGGFYVRVGSDGAISASAEDEFSVPDDGRLPGLNVSKFKLTMPEKNPLIQEVYVRSAPTNVTVRVGALPPFWARLGELSRRETSPDFTPILQEALRTAEVVNGSCEVPFTVHTDVLARIDVHLSVEYARVSSALPSGLPESTLAFDYDGVPKPGSAPVSVDLPSGARVAPGGTRGRVLGSFDSTRLTTGTLGAVPVEASVWIGAGRSQAAPLEIDVEQRIGSFDLLLSSRATDSKLSLSVMSDADGKPWQVPVLGKPLTIMVARDPAGRPKWVNASLEEELRLEARTRYWLVLQSLDGDAEWAAATTDHDPGVQYSLDGGLSWRTSSATGTPGPLRAYTRLRREPNAFEMPVHVVVGATALLELGPDGSASPSGPGTLVPLDRFGPLGHVDFGLELDELARAIDRHLSDTSEAACLETEYLENGDFSGWVNIPRVIEGVREPSWTTMPADWEITSGRGNFAWLDEKFGGNKGIYLGSEDEVTGLSQIVPASAGCAYRLKAVVHADPEAAGSEATVEVLWLRSDHEAIGVTPLTLPTLALIPEVRSKGQPTTRLLDVTAPSGATQAEVRFLVPPRSYALVDEVSLAVTSDRLSNGDMRATADVTDAPAGWSVSPPEAAVDFGIFRTSTQVEIHGARMPVDLFQRVPVKAGSPYEVELHGTTPDDGDFDEPALQIDWLDGAGAPLGDRVEAPLSPRSFDLLVLRGDAPDSAVEAEIRLRLPAVEMGRTVLNLESLAFRQPELTSVPISFLAEAPGEMTLSGADVVYDIPTPVLPPIPPEGLAHATPPGQKPGERPQGTGYCCSCHSERTMSEVATIVTGGGRPATYGRCPQCGSPITTLGGDYVPEAARTAVARGRHPMTALSVAPQGPGALPPTEVRLIGTRREERLAATGIDTLGRLATAKPEVVNRVLGIGLDAAAEVVHDANEILRRGIVVKFIAKVDRSSPFERIQAIGGVDPDGRHWRLPLDEAVLAIEGGVLSFYVEAPEGDRVPVLVARHRGRKYLRTLADGDVPNNLLALPDFPSHAMDEIRAILLLMNSDAARPSPHKKPARQPKTTRTMRKDQ